MRKCVVLVGLMVLGNLAGSRAAAQQDGAAEAAIQKLQLQAVASLDNDRAFRQTVRRFRRLPGDRGFEPLDTIRVDAAVESGVPRFSWPGENRFESYSLAQILNGPTTEAGSLTLHIRSFLLAGEAELEPRGEEQIAGRAALGFELAVPAEKSSFTIRVGETEAALAYRGSIWIDRETGDLIRIEGRVDKDQRVKITRITDRMDFHRVRVGIADLVLPASAELMIEDIFGGAKRNQAVYEDYRPYKPTPADANQSAPIALPSGLTIRVKLQDAIDSDLAAVGDPVQAVVSGNAKKDKKVWVPKGAIVTGRIHHLQRIVEPMTHYVLGLTFSVVRIEGRTQRFSSSVVEAGPFHGLMDSAGGNSKPREVVRGRGRAMKLRPGYLYWDTVRLKVRKGLPVTLRVEE